MAEYNLGSGNDSQAGTSLADTMRGNDGNDTLFGDNGNDFMYGGDGNDSLDGGNNNNFLTGEDGNDKLIGGQNNDTLIGGIGNDFLSGGRNNNGSGDKNFLDGGDDNDTLIGGQNKDSILGGDGNDSIDAGGDGKDIIFAGSGNDTISGFTGSGGARFVDGGTGNDYVIIDAQFRPNNLEKFDTPQNVVIDGQTYQAGAMYKINDSAKVYFGQFSGIVKFNGNTIAPLDVVCFAEGTMIMTAAGERPVESLRAGDMVATLMGGAGLAPVRWLGRRTVDLETHPHGEWVAPILVLPGALGAGVPHRPLRVSPEHALLVDGVLVPAGLLVDGVTILRTPPRGSVTYFHVELDRHDVLLAEGAAAESYLEMDNRHNFENGGLIVALHADFAPAEGALREGCAPRIREGEALDRVRAALAERRAAAAPAGISSAA